MKKLFLIISLALISNFVSAQIKIGGGFTYGNAGLPGITLKAEKRLNDQWSLSPEMHFFFAREGVLRGDVVKRAGTANEIYALSLDFHKQANIDLIENLSSYLIIGVNYIFPVFISELPTQGGNTFIRRETDSGTSLNFGIGGQYEVNESIDLYFEAKGMILGNADQMIATLGVLIDLNGIKLWKSIGLWRDSKTNTNYHLFIF